MNTSPNRTSHDTGYLDAAALTRLHALDPEGRTRVVDRVMRAYETSLQRMLDQLGDARARGDTALIGSLSHTLKASSASVGALALSARCAEAEHAVRSGSTEHLDTLAAELLAEGGRALEAVRAILRA